MVPAHHHLKTYGEESAFLIEAVGNGRFRQGEARLRRAMHNEEHEAPGRLVELRGIEPLTSAVRLQRSPI